MGDCFVQIKPSPSPRSRPFDEAELAALANYARPVQCCQPSVALRHEQVGRR